MDRKSIFENIYENEKWGSKGTLSGEGTRPEAAKEYVEFVRTYLESHLEIKIGNYHWLNFLEQNWVLDSFGLAIVNFFDFANKGVTLGRSTVNRIHSVSYIIQGSTSHEKIFQ
jgi:hypothetical protein